MSYKITSDRASRMLGKIAREEAGATMGLVVVMIVLIGVMGAGLLVFVQRDLQSVVEVNQGQRGFEWADAGIEAAKMELSVDSKAELYDGEDDPADSQWSCAWDGTECTGAGKTLRLAGASDKVEVTIQYLEPATEAQTGLPDFAPEVLPPGETSYPGNRSYFKVVARGTARNANRVVEAIYYTRETGFPQAWYASSTIDWNGNAFESNDVSVFSGGDMEDFRDDNIGGCDVAYGDWYRPPWNNSPRNLAPTLCRKDDGTTYTGYLVGIGAEGTIDYAGGGDRGDFKGSRDYDATTTPTFVDNDRWLDGGAGQNASTEISYPFNPEVQTQVDLEILRALAASGRNGSKLISAGPGETVNVDDYPPAAGPDTVYYVEFVDGDGTYGAKGEVNYTSNALQARGTLVVVNGDFVSAGNDEFGGIIVLRDPANNGLVFDIRGNIGVDGFANVEGGIFVSGSVESTASEELTGERRVGLYTVERWSWRECYRIDCS